MNAIKTKKLKPKVKAVWYVWPPMTTKYRPTDKARRRKKKRKEEKETNGKKESRGIRKKERKKERKIGW